VVAVENIKEAYYSIKSNFVRSILTLMIIAVGITCLVGILTAIDSILFSMSDNFNRLGANAISIRPLSESIKSTNKGKKQKAIGPITIDQATNFKDKYKYSGALVSIDAWCASNVVIKYKSEKTTPTFQVRGADENFLFTASIEIEAGRNFLPSETNKVIIGSEIVKALFDEKPEKSLGQQLIVDGDRYFVVGALKSKGSSSNNSDKRVYIPMSIAKSKYGFPEKNYNLNVGVENAARIDASIEQATGIMRLVRGLRAGEDNDFEIRKSDSVLNQLKEMTSTLRWATIVIALLTLLGASIGLMNIMLVSVTERTKEIGVRKSLGATSNHVLLQFLTEAIVICILGGIVGILLGIGVGFGVTVLIKGKFVIPWAWMILGMVVCIFVGIVSGLYPALKASKLDPIESLRYE
jgi:putative ABC transport system permease protein